MVILHLMGGLGNQMFEYAALKSMMLEYHQDGTIELSGIRGIQKRTHNIYSLDKLNIDSNIKVINKKRSIIHAVNYIIYILYCISKSSKKQERIKKNQKFLNKIGSYCMPEGYIEFLKPRRKNNYMFGYFQSYQYIKKYESEIRNDLQVRLPILEQNKEYYQNIVNTNSICLHIRRGDYVGTNYEVCDLDYYKKAIKKMNQKLQNPFYFVFSDDINWAKENLKMENVTFVDNNNPNYEDLRLMYSCKHFIISNSSFSWWAQFLSNNTQKIVIAPSKWNQTNSNRDLYDEKWEIIEV